MGTSSHTDADLEGSIARQELITDLSRQAVTTGDLDQVFRDAIGAVAETVGTEYCAVVEQVPCQDDGVLRRGIGWETVTDGAMVSTSRGSQMGDTLRTEEPVVLGDLHHDDRLSGSALLTEHDVTSGISVALGPSDDPWGVLGAYTSDKREFTEHDTAFVQHVAAVVTAAIERTERERDLRRKERRYQAIFEDPNILIGLLEPDGTVVDINETAMEYVDADLEDVTGDPFWETPWWGDDGVQDDVREWVERAAAGEYVDFEADLTRPDGRRYVLSGYFRPVTDDGEVVSIIVSDRDVTERKERERALEESEQRYRALVEHFPNGAVALVDEDLRYRTVGGTPPDAVGATAEEVEGQPVREILPTELADGLVPCYEAAFEGDSSAFELEADGRVYQLQVVPVRDKDGDVFAALGMSQDITEHVETQHKLAESERRYRTLVENFPDGSVGLFDEDLRYTAVGGQLLNALDVDPADRIGRSIRELHPDDLLDEIEPYFDAALEGDANSFEIEYRGRYLHANALPIENTAGEVDAGMLVVQDDTERRRYERDLERYREYTDRILDAIDDMFYVIDAEGTIQRWNESVDEVTGFSDDEITSLPALNAIAEEDREAVEDAIAEAFDTGSAQVEAGLISRDGERVPYEFVASALEDPDGDSVLAGIGRDITERKERERALEESEAKFRMLAENLDEMVWISDPETREILHINPAYEAIWDRDRESVYDDPTTFLKAVHPDDRERVERSYAAVPDEGFDEEYRIVRPDGEVRWLDVRAGYVREEGRERVIGIAEDVTERKERERALEESERRYRTLAEDFPNGAVGLFDEDLCYTAVGGQLMQAQGVDPEDRIGHSIRELYPDDIIEEVEPYFHAALEGETNTFEAEYSGRHLYNQTLPVRDADDEVYAGMLVVQDVTERREYERKLEESNERLEQFAYAASHDLQEPLRMVTSYLSLIEGRYGDALDDDGEEFLEFAVDGAERMREMIDALLEYSRVETRGEPFETLDLNAVLEDVLADLQLQIEESGAEITTEDLPHVEGDPGQLRQVFQNLLSNAITYSGDEPPRVHVSAERRNGKWLISVADEGIGIDPDNQDRVFTVFDRLHNRDEYSGTGIGLALCKRIVERHDGEIWVDSEPGKGSTFSFTLPATTDSDR
ncbi:PAS domain S-box protein [Natrinema halophilum]|uniref:histidine kinase n=1 Tax=Natrinema halophilum TaxID=1699371 RepID=A0A7D5GID3_9EURY|nr:PAS domain S-box protein [Natrinema halophilum]QLG49708.1 PAS domain S-box protein [Natrinema halophilum]